MSVDEIEKMVKRNTKNKLIHEGRKIGLFLAGSGFTKYQMVIEINKRLAEIELQKAIDDARTITVEAIDKTPAEPEIKALPAPASQQEEKNNCHKFCVGDFFTFLDEYYTVIKRTPCYVFLQDKNYRTIRADVGIYDRDYSTLNVCKGEEYIIFKISGHEYKIDAKDKEEKPAELIRQEQKLKPEPIKKRCQEEAQNLPKYVYEITPKGHYVIMDNEVLSKGLSNRRGWQIPHLAPFKYGDVIHPENYEISIKISNIALQLENAKDEKTVREILKKYDKSFIRDIAYNAYHFAFDEYERHSVFSFKTTKKDLLALLIKAVLKVNEAMSDAQSKSQFFYIGDRTCYAHNSNQDNKPQETSQNVQQEAKSKNTSKRTRTPRKRVQVTAQDILSCQNENDALSLLMTLKKEDMKNIARDLKISIHSSRRFKINWFMSKEQNARYIAHQLFLRRKIQAKKTSNHDEAPKTNKLENFSYSTNKKTGQISFIFE